MKRVNVKRLCVMGVLIAAAMLFSYVESLVPGFLPIPGVRLGLANIVVLLALLMFKPGEAFLIGFIRVLLSGILFGNPFSLAMSCSGFLLSFLGRFFGSCLFGCRLGYWLCGGFFSSRLCGGFVARLFC